MTVDFGPLAFNTLAGPTRDICVDVGPDEFGSHCLASPGDAWMTQAVDDVKNPASHGCWNEGTCWAVGDVHKEFLVTHWDLSEVEPRLSFSRHSLEFRIENLESCHFREI